MAACVDVIVVNYNTGEILAECVDAVLASVPVAIVIAVDNASSDGSMDALKDLARGDPRLRLVFNDNNQGFAPAVNAGIQRGDSKYVLVLNPDCVVDAGAVERLVEALEGDPLAAVAGPWVTDRQGVVQSGTWRRLPNPWNSFLTLSRLGRLLPGARQNAQIDIESDSRPDATVRAEAVSGACMLIRRSVGERLGWFDERYAMHCEDLDFMCRLRDLGMHCVLVPGASVVHLQGISSARRPFWVHLQKHRGMQRYFTKFQAGDYSLPFRVLVYGGIWLHYALTLPLIAVGRLKSALA